MLRSKRKLQLDAGSLRTGTHAKAPTGPFHEVFCPEDAKPIALRFAGADWSTPDFIQNLFWNAEAVVDNGDGQPIMTFFGFNLNVWRSRLLSCLDGIGDEIAEGAFKFERLHWDDERLVEWQHRELMSRTQKFRLVQYLLKALLERCLAASGKTASG